MKCEICNQAESKYTCPKCASKTCSLKCCQDHKKQNNCDGVRDKTKFLKIEEFKESNLLSDYMFLEEQARVVSTTQRDTLKRHYDITPSMDYLKKLAFNKYSIHLKYMPRHSTKRLANRTRFDKETKTINWHVELKFYTEPNRFEKFNVNDLCASNDTIKDVMEKFFTENQYKLFIHGQLLCKFSDLLKNFGPDLNILFEVYDYRTKQKYYLKLGLNETLSTCLYKKSVIEYPTLIVVPNEYLNVFKLKNEMANKEEGECDDDDNAEDDNQQDDDATVSSLFR
jgi:hypothetical protein